MTIDEEQMRKRLTQGIRFGWVPAKTKKEFKEWANENFAEEGGEGNYGAAFHYLWEFYKGNMPLEGDQLAARVDELEERLSRLESSPKKKRVIKLGSGRMIER